MVGLAPRLQTCPGAFRCLSFSKAMRRIANESCFMRKGNVMGSVGKAFRQWALQQRRDGVVCTEVDDTRLSLTGAHATGTIASYCFEGAPEILEMRVEDDQGDDTLFFLHFELTDLDRAHELFAEMCEVIAEHGRKRVRRVLLCCTAGFTTTMFASKLQEAAKTLSLSYEFKASPLEQMVANSDIDAVMLAPQVGYRRREVAGLFPDACVFEIPAKVFGAYDAGAALRMLCGLLGDVDLAAPDASDLRMARDMRNDYQILLISVVRHRASGTMSWCLFDHYRLVDSDRVHKCSLDYRDLEDLISTLRLRGINLKDIDAIGVALPGAIDYGQVTFSGLVLDGIDIERKLRERFNIPVYVDNNANAGAAGCYVSQDAYDSVILHTQQTGLFVGGQGIIANGHLLRGRRGMAGELGPFARRVFVDGRLHLPELENPGTTGFSTIEEGDMCWRAEAMLPVLATTLMASIAICAPDAIYISYDLIDDMDVLRAELAKQMDEAYIPDLIHITDYYDKIIAEELALVLQRLNAAAS